MWREGLNYLALRLVVPMYAHDMVATPIDNIDPLIREFIRLGGLSGIHINCSKSIIFPLTDAFVPFTMLTMAFFRSASLPAHSSDVGGLAAQACMGGSHTCV